MKPLVFDENYSGIIHGAPDEWDRNRMEAWETILSGERDSIISIGPSLRMTLRVPVRLPSPMDGGWMHESSGSSSESLRVCGPNAGRIR